MHALSAHHKEIAGIAAAPQKQIERVTKLISNICLILIKNISIKAGHKIDCRQENESKDPLQSFFIFAKFIMCWIISYLLLFLNH